MSSGAISHFSWEWGRANLYSRLILTVTPYTHTTVGARDSALDVCSHIAAPYILCCVILISNVRNNILRAVAQGSPIFLAGVGDSWSLELGSQDSHNIDEEEEVEEDRECHWHPDEGPIHPTMRVHQPTVTVVHQRSTRRPANRRDQRQTWGLSFLINLTIQIVRW